MSQADDLCSTVSRISTSFTVFDDGGEEEEGIEEPPEMKYEPPEVKAEIPDDICNVTEEDIDDDFLNRYFGENENDGDVEESVEPWSAPKETKRTKTPGTGRRGGKRGGGRVREKQVEDFPIEEETQEKRGRRRRAKVKVESSGNDDTGDEGDGDDRDGDWAPEEDDDWRPTAKNKKQGPGKKRRSVGRPKSKGGRGRSSQKSGKRGRPPVSSEDGIKVELEDSDGSTRETSQSRSEGSRRKRKRISEMTPDEAERERARWREKRQKERERQKALKEAMKNDCTGESDASSLSNATFGRRKKRVSEMTEEEKAAAQARWKREHEKRKARRESMAPEQREAEKAKARERQRLRRALAKQGALPEEQMRSMEEQARKDRERKKRRRAAMSAEQKKEEMHKCTMYRLARIAKMTEEEKQARKMHNYMQSMARWATMTTEEKERRRQKIRAAGTKRYRKLKEKLGIEGIREMRRNYWHSMTPERKEKALAKLRECHQRRVEKLKSEGKWEEVKKQWYERDMAYKKKRKEKGDEYVRQRRIREDQRKGGDEVVKEENEGTGKKGRSRKAYAELPEEQKEKRNHYRRMYTLKKKLAVQKLLDSGMSMEEIKQQTETPEQRERRLIQQRIRKAKANLRQRLQNSGAPPEEIERKCEELKQTYTPTYGFRPYKPRPDNFRRVDPTVIPEIEALGEVELKLAETKAPLLQVSDPLPVPDPPPVPSPPKRKRRNAKKEPAEGQEPPPKKKRGRPFKYPPPPQAPSTSLVKPPPPVVPTTLIISSQPGLPVQIQQQPLPQISLTPAPLFPPPQMYSPPNSQYPPPVYPSTSQVVFHYPHQQPQAPPPTYTLQHILDGITFPDPPGPSQPAPTFHYDTSATSSYYDDDPPASPGAPFDDYSPEYPAPPAPNLPLPPPPPILKKEATSPAKPRAPRKYYYRPPKNPNAKTRTKRKDVIRDCVCDVCGLGYNRQSLRAHKNQLHNPNYDILNRLCLLCNEPFKHAQKWYSHYLHAHQKPKKDVALKSHICELCGQAFANNENYKKHQYYMHGDGLKIENYLKCPICPEEKLFKEKMGYYSHLKRFHPYYVRPGHDCYRCDKSFPNEKVLAEHVGSEHPESYFPCYYCSACRFSQLGLYFHYSRCAKITREERDRIKKEVGGSASFSLEWTPIGCELCGKTVMLSSLTRHYREMHSVKEDQFRCELCHKLFKTRSFWANHLEEKHRLTVEEVKERAGKLNAEDREGMTVQPRQTRVGRPKRGGKKGGRRKKEEDLEEASEEEEWKESEGEETKKKKTKRRNIVVICEEDELEGTEETPLVK